MSTLLRLWLPVGAVVGVLALTITVATVPLNDPDLWWHLVAGEGYVYEGWSLADPPPLTPFSTVPWFSRSWLLEMAVAPVYEVAGLPGVAWVYGLGLVVLTLTVYFSCRRWGDPLSAGLTTLITAAGVAGSATERPQLFGYILLALVTSAWLHAARSGRPPWWTIPVTWVWSASHGTWVVGVAVGLGVVVGMLLDAKLRPRDSIRWFAVPLGALATGALSPVGFRNILAFSDVRGFQEYITEFVPPSLENPHMLGALLLVAIVTVPALRGATRLDWTDLSILAHGSLWILYTVRSIAWGALMIAPLAARSLHVGMAPNREATPIGSAERLTLLGSGLVCLVVLGLLVPRTSTQPGGVPTALDDHLSALPAGTTVVNAYFLGGWIEWRHPHLAPVIDGNTNGYEPQDLADHVHAGRAGEGWREYVEEHDGHVALLSDESALALALRERLDWVVVGTDGQWVLLQDPAGVAEER